MRRGGEVQGVGDRASDARRIVRELVGERERLRRQQADAVTLEANRLALVYWQDALARRR